MSERYFCESSLTDETATLSGPEARHLATVMRAKVGDRIVLFNGAGIECEASVVRLGKRDVQLRIDRRQEIDREASRELTLAVALPKGDRQKWMVEKAVELGVAKLIPLTTQRSVVKLKQSGIERLRRTVIEAAKQCGRNRLLTIEPAQSFNALATSALPAGLRLLAHPAGTGGITNSDCEGSDSGIAAIGPEGGFTDAEAQMALDAGWRIVSLGQRVLRVETAALRIAALLLRD